MKVGRLQVLDGLLDEGGRPVSGAQVVLAVPLVLEVWPADHLASHSASVQASADGDPVSQKVLPVLLTV